MNTIHLIVTVETTLTESSVREEIKRLLEESGLFPSGTVQLASKMEAQ